MSKIDVTAKLARTEASLKRWQTRLRRAVNRVTELDRDRRRYQLLLTVPTMPPEAIASATTTPPIFDIPLGPIPTIVVENVKAGLGIKEKKQDIPAFLDRADPHIAAKMTAARKAKEAEERRKMPLTGKAALAKIREKK